MFIIIRTYSKICFKYFSEGEICALQFFSINKKLQYLVLKILVSINFPHWQKYQPIHNLAANVGNTRSHSGMQWMNIVISGLEISFFQGA